MDGVPTGVGHPGSNQLVKASEVGNAFLSMYSGPTWEVPFVQDLSGAFLRVVRSACANRPCDVSLGVLFPFVVVFLCEWKG